MSLYKIAQILNVEDDITEIADDDQVILYETRPSKDEVIEMHSDPEEMLEVGFALPMLPGSNAAPLEVICDPVEVKEEKEEEKEEKKDKNKAADELEVDDPWGSWKKKGPGSVVNWAQDMLSFVPTHSGREIFGIERAIAFLERMLKELSAAVRTDLKGEIDIAQLEHIKNEVVGGIERLETHKDKLEKEYRKGKKTSEQQNTMVKEGQKAAHVGNIVITVPLLISSIARTAINSSVSSGKDLEHTVDMLIKNFDLNAREQMELIQLLSDMNWPIRRPRMTALDAKIDWTSSDTLDYSAQYPA